MTAPRQDYLAIADFLMDGAPGMELLPELRRRFPHAKRDDVYRGVALAWAHVQAGWLIDVCELQALKDSLARADPLGTIPDRVPTQ